MAGLFDPSFRGAGSPGAPGVGSTQRGLQLVAQGKGKLESQQLGLQGERDTARIDSLIQGAVQLKQIQDPQQKLAFLQNRRAELERAGISTVDTDEAIQLAQSGDFAALEEITDQAISLGQKSVSAKEQAETGKLVAETGKIEAETRDVPLKDKEKQLALEVAAAKTKFDQATKIRGEITKASTDFDKIIGSFDRIQASASDTSAAGDLALIFNFMKMLDPGSVVRESEFATAANAAGVPDRIRNTFNKVLTGERLGDDQRKDFVGQAENIFTASKKRNDQTVESFIKIAERNNIAREDVLVPRGEALEEQTQEQQLSEGDIVVNRQTGQRLQVVNGELVEIQ